MKQLSIMIKPASSLCNLRCKYCFYANITSLREVASFGIMKEETTEAMIDHIYADLDDGDRLTLAFQGGEPTLAGLSYYRHLVEYVKKQEKKVAVSYAIQTNGILLDEEWCRFLADNHFLAGISLDLLPEGHDRVRVDEKGAGTYRLVTAAMERLNRYHVEYNVLCTLTNQTARHPRKVWNSLVKLDLSYVQFTPCLDELDHPGESVYALTPERFASFYCGIFDLWYEELQKGRYRSIKLFDDLMQLLASGRVTACGILGNCQPQIIVEADGSAYPCDFYCLDEYRLGSFLEDGVRSIYERSAVSPSKQREPLPKLCFECPFQRICGGGCKRMQREVCLKPGDSFCGYQEFLKCSINRLAEAAGKLSLLST